MKSALCKVLAFLLIFNAEIGGAAIHSHQAAFRREAIVEPTLTSLRVREFYSQFWHRSQRLSFPLIALAGMLGHFNVALPQVASSGPAPLSASAPAPAGSIALYFDDWLQKNKKAIDLTETIFTSASTAFPESIIRFNKEKQQGEVSWTQLVNATRLNQAHQVHIEFLTYNTSHDLFNALIQTPGTVDSRSPSIALEALAAPEAHLQSITLVSGTLSDPRFYVYIPKAVFEEAVSNKNRGELYAMMYRELMHIYYSYATMQIQNQLPNESIPEIQTKDYQAEIDAIQTLLNKNQGSVDPKTVAELKKILKQEIQPLAYWQGQAAFRTQFLNYVKEVEAMLQPSGKDRPFHKMEEVISQPNGLVFAPGTPLWATSVFTITPEGTIDLSLKIDPDIWQRYLSSPSRNPHDQAIMFAALMKEANTLEDMSVHEGTYRKFIDLLSQFRALPPGVSDMKLAESLGRLWISLEKVGYKPAVSYLMETGNTPISSQAISQEASNVGAGRNSPGADWGKRRMPPSSTNDFVEATPPPLPVNRDDPVKVIEARFYDLLHSPDENSDIFNTEIKEEEYRLFEMLRAEAHRDPSILRQETPPDSSELRPPLLQRQSLKIKRPPSFLLRAA